MILGLTPLFHFLDRVYQDVLREAEVRQPSPKPGHLLPPALAGAERVVLHDEEVQIGIWARCPSGLGAEEDHLLGVYLLDNDSRHFFDHTVKHRHHYA